MAEGLFALAPAAASDIEEIWDFIAADSVDAADRVVDELFAAMEEIARRPGIGHLRTDLAPESTRVWRVRSYLMIYLPTSRPLQIVRVLSGYRDIPAVLGYSPPE